MMMKFCYKFLFLRIILSKKSINFLELCYKWSWAIIAWVSLLILFNVLLTVMVGLKIFDFSDMQWFITAVTVEMFLQIVGMGYIAVTFFFK
jgi:hypothetical protein